MNLENLFNLVKVGQLKEEPFDDAEFKGLFQSGLARLNDAAIETLSPESRFDLAYNSAHSLALASLRWHGFRANNRFIVFQSLPHTVGAGPEVWRVLAKCHDCRNLAEYEDFLEIDEQLLTDLMTSTQILLERVKDLCKN